MFKRLKSHLEYLSNKHRIQGTFHVNGVNHLNAVIVVDFVQPFKTIEFDDALFNQTVEQVRMATVEYFERTVPKDAITVQWDAREGIIYSQYKG